MPRFSDAAGSDEGFRRTGLARVLLWSHPTCRAPHVASDVLASAKELETSPKTGQCPSAPRAGEGLPRGLLRARPSVIGWDFSPPPLIF